MGKRLIPPEPAEIHEVMLRDALEERYLAYALSTIMHRALPDARDGLKPVHRRILYGMRLLRLDPGTPFKKSAKIVGDVMGSFHPHGDQSIYDALVRLAQDFSSRYPLVDGQGNFGNIDGDNPAAYRYTEARMTDVARLLLEGIDEDGVEFRANYDGQTKEPIVLPGGFPNLLANGAQGIAVGMATSIPPHNAAELCDAALHLIDKPDAKSKTLLKWVKGPDFPTGGIIVDSKESIAEAYMTGRGSFRTRAKWNQEEGARGTWVVVITEIPWLVQKSRLVEKIAELLNEKKLPLVGDVRDESAEDIRLVIEPKSRAVDPELLMESLFKLTELESRIPLNLNVLVKGRIPKVLGLAECLREWLDHLRDVLLRRSNYRKEQIEHRLEVLGGYLIAYLNIDKVIKIIRTEDEPKPALIKAFKLTEIQADAILNMRLRSLRKLEEFEIRTEDKNLRAELKGIKGILASETEQWSKVGEQVRKVRDIFGPKTPLGKRRTHVRRRARARSRRDRGSLCRARAGHRGGFRKGLGAHAEGPCRRSLGPDLQDRRQARQGVLRRDHVKTAAVRHQRPVLFARRRQAAGRARPWRADPDVHRHGAGDRDRVAVRQQGRPQVPDREPRRPGLCRERGRLRRQYPQGQAGAERRDAERSLRDRDRVGDTVAVIGTNHKMVVFPLDQVPEMARGRGVRLQKYTSASLSDVATFESKAGLTWKDSAGRDQSMSWKELTDWRGNRADAGRLAHGLPKSNKFGAGVE